MGMRIRVEDKANRGTVFQFTYPKVI
jgi:hypothetical protein